MKNIERIIESQYPPRQTNVAWKDVNENTLKFYVDGEWRALKDEDFRQKQADWNQTDNTKEDFIKNKPTIPDAQIQSDWAQTNTSALDYIKNKPTGIVVSEDVTGLVVCTASEYEEIDPKDPTVLYLIKES